MRSFKPDDTHKFCILHQLNIHTYLMAASYHVTNAEVYDFRVCIGVNREKW